MDTVTITRVAQAQWEAVADDLVVGRGDVSRRPDGRLFLSIDVWRDAAFDRLAATMLADLPTPLHTLVGEDDHDTTARWERFGFTVGRREGAYDLPTDPRESGLDATRLPAGVTVLPAGEADEHLLRSLDRAIRDEVEAAVGRRVLPAELLAGPPGDTLVDPSKYAVAVLDGDAGYAGLVRVVRVRRRARVGLVAVRADRRRRGIGRALLAHALEGLHRDGIASAWTEVDDSDVPALALARAAGARRATGHLELVRR
ncbi:GNAT family N-acetyltransferase [Streptomyces chilikensis]|uniref:GNAT family N-acetyltransferase n=1 Tax=Streptomyces chilikensis TaxID=1194079 RepID=A0ABV3EPX1_9ACTN